MEDMLGTLVSYFEDAEERSRDNRTQAERVRDFVDGKHWTKEEEDILKERGQPAYVFNFCKDKVNFILGYERQTKTDPKAFPRNPSDDEAAEAATDALRYVQDNSDLEEAYSSVNDNMAVEGYGGLELLIEQKANGKKEIAVKHWPWDRLFYDPHSSAHNFSDARYVGGYVWKDLEDVHKQYPDKKAEINTAFNSKEVGDSDTFKDKPRDIWGSKDGKRKRVQIVQIYYKQGDQWWWAHLTKGAILEGPHEVPHKDDSGESFCPLFLQSAYVDRNNRRYGEVENIISLNEAYNKSLSKMTWFSNANQTMGELGAVPDENKFKTQKQRPDGHLEVNPGKTIETVDQSQKMQLTSSILAEAKATLEVMGPNASLQGKNDGASGKAIIASQQGGIMNLTLFFGRFRHLKLRVYRAIWFMIQQYWDEQRWVRVTDNDGNARFAGLNTPRTVEKQAQMDFDSPEEVKAFLAEKGFRGDEPFTDELNQPVIDNKTAEMDMDIILEEAPDTVTIQQEQFEQIVNLAQSGVPFTPEQLIMASSLRNKQEILENMKGGGEEQQPPTPQEQAQAQFMQELQQRGLTASVAAAEGKAMKAHAEAEKIAAETPLALQNY